MGISIFKNGKIYTGSGHEMWAQAMAVKEDQLIYVGCNEDCPKGDEIFDLHGKMVLPSFVDSHTHPGAVSQSSWHIKLPWTDHQAVILDFIKKYAEEHPKEEVPFLYFEYYPTSMFGVNGPTKELLDQACSDRPCYCQDFGEHLHWMNSKMLELLGVTKETEDPVPGLEIFVRDKEGNPTGWCKELAWLHFQDRMYEKLGWNPPTELTAELMKPYFSFLSAHGITAIADGVVEGESQLIAMKQLEEEGQLNAYYDGINRFYSYQELPEKIEELKEYQRKYGSKHMKFNTMKLFLDGTNESGTAASLEPFVNDPEGKNNGEMLMELEELTNCFSLCNEEKVDLHIHIVGDRGFRTACDAVEEAQKRSRAKKVPWVCQPIFAHCELTNKEDRKRPGALGITINWSCHWSGGYFGEVAQEYYGYEKWAEMYQFQEIIETGALVTFSSDVVTGYELHRADPFFSIEVAATRVDKEFPLDIKKYPGSVRPPDSAKLSRDMLLKGYTLNGAKQMHQDHLFGSLEPGKLANFIVLSEDLFEVPEEEVSRIKVEATIFEGKLIFGSLTKS